MSKKAFYKYNPQTSSYERVYPSKKEKFFSVLRHIFSGIIVGAITFGVFTYFVQSPGERKKTKEQELLLNQYEILTKRLDEALLILDDIQQRDDNLYRVILQSDPISSKTRKAAFENVKRYEDLLTLPDADLVVSTTQKMDLLARQLYIQSNSFEEIIDLGKTHEEKLRKLPAIQPVANKDLKRTASGYGWRVDPIYKTRKFHEGMDFSAAIGTPVFATGEGVVIATGWQQGYGNTVEIDHGFGYKTVYAHLNKIKTKKGAKVNRGDEIGEVGNTGKSTGPHLHYEVRLKGKPMNPMNYYFMDLSPEEYDAMIQIASNQGQVMD
ncbi:MAG: M23 family metallopeptidase [Bacteroidales bacterium]|nr:M23 family metallopeptidase [Bacteroidales bacterium]